MIFRSDLPLTAGQDTGKTALPGTRYNPVVPPNSPLNSQHSFVERCVPDDGGLVGWTAAADATEGMVPMPTHNNVPWLSSARVRWAPERYSVGRPAFAVMTSSVSVADP